MPCFHAVESCKRERRGENPQPTISLGPMKKKDYPKKRGKHHPLAPREKRRERVARWPVQNLGPAGFGRAQQKGGEARAFVRLPRCLRSPQKKGRDDALVRFYKRKKGEKGRGIFLPSVSGGGDIHLGGGSRPSLFRPVVRA